MNTKLFALLFLLSGAAFAQGEYQGPEILSRGGTDVGQRNGQPVDLHFFADVSGIYDTAFTPVSIGNNGKIVDLGGVYGVEADLGLYGTHSWNRSVLRVNYHGDYRDYNQDVGLNGTDQQLELRFQHQFSRRLAVVLREAAGTASYAFGTIGGYGTPENPFIAVPTDQIFDNRVTFGQSGVSVVYQKSARLSYSLGGDGFAVRHQASGFVGLNGYDARGDVAYRISRVSTITADYNYDHFDYEGLFGSSDAHSLALGYNRSLTRRWQLLLRGGIVYVQSKGLAVVQNDPAVAAILGEPTTITAFYATSLFPLVDGRISAHFRHSTLSFQGGQTINPGNGVFLTSKSEEVGSYYSYSGIRKLDFSLHGYYSRLSSVGQQIGTYAAYTAGSGLTYKMVRSFRLIVNFDARHYNIPGQPGVLAPFNQNSYRVAVGIGFSPGEIPLVLW